MKSHVCNSALRLLKGNDHPFSQFTRGGVGGGELYRMPYYDIFDKVFGWGNDDYASAAVIWKSLLL